jgi:hypothetical protein
MMALHEQSVGATDEWYTPAHVFAALDCVFDVDVAAARYLDRRMGNVPARAHIFEESLVRDWGGAFVWMNPPFGGRNGLVPWREKFFVNGNGIALVPDRTSAPWFQQFAPRADLMLFVTPKLQFINVHGKPGRSPAQGTCLLAKRERGVSALRRAARSGLVFFARPESAT